MMAASRATLMYVWFPASRCALFRRPMNLQNLRTIELFSDPTPTKIINQRYLHRMLFILTQTDLNQEEFDRFLNSLLFVCKKLVAVWNHYHRYAEIEDVLVAQANDSVGLAQEQKISYSQDLLLEFDEFLVQVKSSLDYLVKLPVPIVGRCWNLRTFKKDGHGVINALHGSIPDKWKGTMTWLADTVILAHMPWLEATINGRDMVNHCLEGGVQFEAFIVCKVIQDGKERIHTPRFEDGVTIRTMMDITWKNLFSLVEDFTGSFLGLRLKEGYVLSRGEMNDHTSLESPWNAMKQMDYERLKFRDAFLKSIDKKPR
jgi:hypothetical protein